MSKIYFTKLTGAGNDFILVDEKLNSDFSAEKNLIGKMCDRRFGIGADGLLFIKKSDKVDFEMEYYNSDGGIGSLCGNGARCIIRYAGDSGWFNDNNTKFMCSGKIYSGLIINEEETEFRLQVPHKIKLNFKIKAFDQLINASYADTGSPHVVININDVLRDNRTLRSAFTDIKDFPVIEVGKEIRYSKDFAPLGTNVNFIQIYNDEVHIRTYERGVEDETYACGTGSVAAAIIGYLNYGISPPVKIITKKGNNLLVNFNYINKQFTDLTLSGPAKIVFNGEININEL